MSFIKIDGYDFKLYVPGDYSVLKKHPCLDCYSCRFCSDERCSICLKNKCCESFSSDIKKDDDEKYK